MLALIWTLYLMIFRLQIIFDSYAQLRFNATHLFCLDGMFYFWQGVKALIVDYKRDSYVALESIWLDSQYVMLLLFVLLMQMMMM